MSAAEAISALSEDGDVQAFVMALNADQRQCWELPCGTVTMVRIGRTGMLVDQAGIVHLQGFPTVAESEAAYAEGASQLNEHMARHQGQVDPALASLLATLQGANEITADGPTVRFA